MKLKFVNIVYSFCSTHLARATKPWQQEYSLVRNIWRGHFPNPQGQLPLTILERSFMSFLVILRSFSLLHVASFQRNFISGSIISELYVIAWFFILLAMLIFNASLAEWLTITLVFYRLIDGFNYNLCILFVDQYKKDLGLRSLNRLLILLLINYLEIIIGFATLYLVTDSVGYKNGASLSSQLDALYFSVITVTTLGYGDIVPIIEAGKWLCLTETFMGLILIVLVIGSFLKGNKLHS